MRGQEWGRGESNREEGEAGMWSDYISSFVRFFNYNRVFIYVNLCTSCNYATNKISFLNKFTKTFSTRIVVDLEDWKSMVM